ncbi:MAG: YraN family protein [Candidatus Kerfeldbacteria bacterium]|nr:YraN family protein [Candidatus Kerfeldbacteria bacterium]
MASSSGKRSVRGTVHQQDGRDLPPFFVPFHRHVLGRAGETLAARYLETAGFVIRARQYRTRFGEIDIVAERLGVLHFIEVKARSSVRFGTPLESLTPRKCAALCAAAASYLQESGWRGAYQLDAIAIRLHPFPTLDHVGPLELTDDLPRSVASAILPL